MSFITKEELIEIQQMKGMVIGTGLKKDREFVLKEAGEEGLRKIEKEMEKLGYPLTYEEIEKYKWYPVQVDALFMLLTKRILGWSDEKIREWAKWEAKVHFLTQLMMKYFVSMERLAKEVGKHWRKYYSQGELITEKASRKERVVILALRNFKTLPVHCRFLEGFFYQIASYVVPRENLEVKEIESKEKNTHRFKITW